jgi:PAS domain S-box-containing protein
MLGGGSMIDQMSERVVKAILEALPVELTVIDEKDEVVGWNKFDTRIFKRPLTSMGLNFRECHPAESLAKVEEIVEEMRGGTRDTARFWIDLKLRSGETHKVLIEFFALRDDRGAYLGCLECAQDVQGIRELEGEKRLLD